MTGSKRGFLWLLAAIIAAPAPAAAQASASELFDDSRVQIVNLTMADADWQTLRDNYLKKTWYHVTMTWNGLTSADAGVRSHGGTGSRSPVKPNLDVDFGRFAAGRTWLGVPWVLLKANNQDPSNLREWLAMKFFHRAGLPAPREAPAQLYLNGKLLGMYYLVENIDTGMLQRNFGESAGYLYEWNYADSYALNGLGPDPSVYAKFLDLKSGPGSADITTFAAMIQAVNRDGVPSADYIREVSRYINPGLFLSEAAAENVIGEEDGLLGDAGTNNVYLYQFAGTTQFQFLPWDKDRTLQDWARSITTSVVSGTVNQLARRLYAIDTFRTVYLAEHERLMALFGGPGGWADTEVSRQYELIKTTARNDPGKQCNYTGVVPEPCGAEDFENSVASLRTYIGGRAGFVAAELRNAGYQGPVSRPSVSSVRMGATGQQQVCPGALASIEGTALGASSRAVTAPLPRLMGDTFAALDGARLPLLSVAPGRMEVQFSVDSAVGAGALVVFADGAMSNTYTLNLTQAAPLILAVARADGSLAVPGNAPGPGEIVIIYTLGLGSVNPGLPAGTAAPNDALIYTALVPSLTLGNASMDVLFSGLTPGMVGLYQINARMPSSLPNGGTGLMTLVQGGESTSAEIVLH